MAHSICTPPQGGVAYFQRLLSLLLAPEMDLWSKLDRLFAEETDEFDLNYAFVSRIDTDARTQHFELVHGSHEQLVEGNTVPLSETYCRKTIADPEGTMAINDAPAEGWDGDPAYERFGLGTYLGTTITVENDLYGTLCFADESPRQTPITDEEVTLLRIHAQWVTYELNQWTGPPPRKPVSTLFDGRESALSTRIDTVTDALGDEARRSILRALLDDTTESLLDISDYTTDGKHAIQLHHVHLPKLEQGGFIEWDRDSNTVSRGPHFSELEPLLQLLGDYTSEIP